MVGIILSLWVPLLTMSKSATSITIPKRTFKVLENAGIDETSSAIELGNSDSDSNSSDSRLGNGHSDDGLHEEWTNRQRRIDQEDRGKGNILSTENSADKSMLETQQREATRGAAPQTQQREAASKRLEDILARQEEAMEPGRANESSILSKSDLAPEKSDNVIEKCKDPAKCVNPVAQPIVGLTPDGQPSTAFLELVKQKIKQKVKEKEQRRQGRAVLDQLEQLPQQMEKNPTQLQPPNADGQIRHLQNEIQQQQMGNPTSAEEIIARGAVGLARGAVGFAQGAAGLARDAADLLPQVVKNAASAGVSAVGPSLAGWATTPVEQTLQAQRVVDPNSWIGRTLRDPETGQPINEMRLTPAHHPGVTEEHLSGGLSSMKAGLQKVGEIKNAEGVGGLARFGWDKLKSGVTATAGVVGAVKNALVDKEEHAAITAEAIAKATDMKKVAASALSQTTEAYEQKIANGEYKEGDANEIAAKAEIEKLQVTYDHASIGEAGGVMPPGIMNAAMSLRSHTPDWLLRLGNTFLNQVGWIFCGMVSFYPPCVTLVRVLTAIIVGINGWVCGTGWDAAIDTLIKVALPSPLPQMIKALAMADNMGIIDKIVDAIMVVSGGVGGPLTIPLRGVSFVVNVLKQVLPAIVEQIYEAVDAIGGPVSGAAHAIKNKLRQKYDQRMAAGTTDAAYPTHLTSGKLSPYHATECKIWFRLSQILGDLSTCNLTLSRIFGLMGRGVGKFSGVAGELVDGAGHLLGNTVDQMLFPINLMTGRGGQSVAGNLIRGSGKAVRYGLTNVIPTLLKPVDTAGKIANVGNRANVVFDTIGRVGEKIGSVVSRVQSAASNLYSLANKVR